MSQQHARWARAVAGAFAAGALALPLALTPVGAAAQTTYTQNQQGAPVVSAFDVRQVDRIEPGVDLEFTIWGTPGSTAVLQIEGAQRAVQLIETSPGVYQGYYTVTRRDAIQPNARVSANLRRGNRIATALLDEPLQENWRAPVATGSAAQIDRFNTYVTEQRGSQVMHFEVRAAPGSRVSVAVPGATERRVILNEVRAGEYVGTYTIQPSDRIATDRPLRARVRYSDGRVAMAQADVPAVRVLGSFNSSNDVSSPYCVDCGRIVSIVPLEVKGEGGLVGTAAGGVLGAVLGSQIGGGDGRKVAGVAGAIGGALLGREIERRRGSNTDYEVTLDMSNGARRTIMLDDMPAFRVGDAVRIVDGKLQALAR